MRYSDLGAEPAAQCRYLQLMAVAAGAAQAGVAVPRALGCGCRGWWSNILGGRLACAALGSFFGGDGAACRVVVACSLFPLILTLAESGVAAQSMTLAIEQAASRRSNPAGFCCGRLRRAVMLGACSGASVGCVSLLWRGPRVASLTIAGSVFITMLLAAVLWGVRCFAGDLQVASESADCFRGRSRWRLSISARCFCICWGRDAHAGSVRFFFRALGCADKLLIMANCTGKEEADFTPWVARSGWGCRRCRWGIGGRGWRLSFCGRRG